MTGRNNLEDIQNTTETNARILVKQGEMIVRSDGGDERIS